MNGIRFINQPSPYIALEEVRAAYEALERSRPSGDLHDVAQQLHDLENAVTAAKRAVYQAVDQKNADLRKLLGIPDWD